MKIDSKRLILRSYEDGDISDLVEGLNNIEVAKWMAGVPFPYTEKDAKDFIERTKNNDENSKIELAIVLKENNELVGNIGFNNVDLIHRSAALNIIIGEEEKRGQGYGKEAIKLLLEYGFNNLNLNNVMLKVYSFNRGAIKMYESLGFKKFGTRHNSYYFKGKFYDEIQMEILKEEYTELEPFIYI